MSEAIITLKDVKKGYGTTLVLNGLDLEIEAGHLYALLGRNGTGKSTLMRMLMRHEPIEVGQGIAFGRDMKLDLAYFNSQIGFVSENISYQSLTMDVGDILEFHKSIRERWDDAYVAEALKVLHIPVKNSYAGLSRGQKMQVAFLTASAFWPKLLLLDEITSVLDAVARDFFLRRLDRYVDEGGTAIVATNIISEVQQFTDKVILLQDGKARFNASLPELTAKFIKLRKPRDQSHAVFSHKECVELGIDSYDGSLLFLVPEELARGLPEVFRYPAKATVSDLFLFMSKVRE